MASNTLKAQVAASPRDLNPAGFDMTSGSVVSVLGATYTVLPANSIIINISGGTLTATLPSAASFTHRQLFFCNKGGGAINSASADVGPIIGGSDGTPILAAGAGKWAHLVSDGSTWQIIGGN